MDKKSQVFAAVVIVLLAWMIDLMVSKHMLKSNLEATQERLEIQIQLTEDSINLAIRFMPDKYKVKYLDAVMANTKKVYADYYKKK